jgi:RNA polymerase sigma-70 factor (ECF subfamily)
VESEDVTDDIARLTRKLVRGDEAAFREFHARYFDRLYHFLLLVAHGREHEAQEALQETLLRVARCGREFEDEETLWCWLKAVARNAARDGGRKRLRYSALLRNFAHGRPQDNGDLTAPDDDRLSAILTECLDELLPEDRRLLEGKYLDGSTIKELAGLTALTEKAVESRLGRLRSRLRKTLLNKLNEP